MTIASTSRARRTRSTRRPTSHTEVVSAHGRRRAARAARNAETASAAAGGSAAARPLCSNVSNTRTRAIGVILIKNPLMASTWLIATLLVYALGTIGKICQSNAMQRRPSGHYASIVVSRVRRPIPKRWPIMRLKALKREREERRRGWLTRLARRKQGVWGAPVLVLDILAFPCQDLVGSKSATCTSACSLIDAFLLFTYCAAVAAVTG